MAVTADDYFAVIPESVLYADISSHAVRVYAVLRRYADKQGSAHPSRKTIAEHAHVSIDTVKRAVSELEEHGFLMREERFSEGRRTSNSYHLVLHPRRGTDAPGVRSTPAPGEGGTRAPTGTIAIENQSQKNQRTTAFDTFWLTFPRREGKSAAKKKWDALVKTVGADVLIAGAVRYRDDPNRDPAYTCHPATWLNQGRWEDEPLPPRNGHKPSKHERIRALADRMEAQGL